jgi:hypothetical protein
LQRLEDDAEHDALLAELNHFPLHGRFRLFCHPMKQKVRFILKKMGKRSSSDAPEQAVTTFEASFAGLTRAVYEGSSKATHVAGEREAVVQLRRYVVAILHDIIET